MKGYKIFKIIGITALVLYVIVIQTRAIYFKQVALDYKEDIVECNATIDSLDQVVFDTQLLADDFEIELNRTLEFLKYQNTKLVDNGIPLY